jgi:hypothetical protein
VGFCGAGGNPCDAPLCSYWAACLSHACRSECFNTLRCTYGWVNSVSSRAVRRGWAAPGDTTRPNAHGERHLGGVFGELAPRDGWALEASTPKRGAAVAVGDGARRRQPHQRRRPCRANISGHYAPVDREACAEWLVPVKGCPHGRCARPVTVLQGCSMYITPGITSQAPSTPPSAPSALCHRRGARSLQACGQPVRPPAGLAAAASPLSTVGAGFGA